MADQTMPTSMSSSESASGHHTQAGDAYRVFISYSHDSPEHCERILALADVLRSHGIDAELDAYHVRPSEGWPLWCEKQLRPENSAFVLMICTETYCRRVEDKTCADEGRGVFWEGQMIYDYIYDEKGNTRFIPILLSGSNTECIPRPVRNHTRYRIEQFDFRDKGYESLYRELTNQPAVAKPDLGKVVPLPVRQVATRFLQPDASQKTKRNRLILGTILTVAGGVAVLLLSYFLLCLPPKYEPKQETSTPIQPPTKQLWEVGSQEESVAKTGGEKDIQSRPPISPSPLPDSVVIFDAAQWDEREVNKKSEVVCDVPGNLLVSLRTLGKGQLGTSKPEKDTLAIEYQFSSATEAGLHIVIPDTKDEKGVHAHGVSLNEYAQGSFVLRLKPASGGGPVRFGLKLCCEVNGKTVSSNGDKLVGDEGRHALQDDAANRGEWRVLYIPIEPYLKTVRELAGDPGGVELKQSVRLLQLYLVFGEQYSSPDHGEIRLNSICLSKAVDSGWCKVGTLSDITVFWQDIAFHPQQKNQPTKGQWLRNVDTVTLYEMPQEDSVVRAQISKEYKIHIIDVKSSGSIVWAKVDIVWP